MIRFIPTRVGKRYGLHDVTTGQTGTETVPTADQAVIAARLANAALQRPDWLPETWAVFSERTAH